ncbi:MAG: WD40 repeat domain-containing protein [Anaerolineae bacterium]
MTSKHKSQFLLFCSLLLTVLLLAGSNWQFTPVAAQSYQVITAENASQLVEINRINLKEELASREWSTATPIGLVMSWQPESDNLQLFTLNALAIDYTEIGVLAASFDAINSSNPVNWEHRATFSGLNREQDPMAKAIVLGRTFSPRGIYTTSLERQDDRYVLQLWLPEENEQLQLHPFDEYDEHIFLGAMTLNPDGTTLAILQIDESAGKDNRKTQLKLWSVENDKLISLTDLELGRIYVKYIFFSPDGTRLGVTFIDLDGENAPDKIAILDAATGELLADYADPIPDAGTSADIFSPDSHYLLFYDTERKAEPYVHLLDWQTGDIRPLTPPSADKTNYPPFEFAFSPDGKLLAMLRYVEGQYYFTDVLEIWDVATGTLITQRYFKDVFRPIGAQLGFSPDGTMIAVLTQREQRDPVYISVWAIDPAGADVQASAIALQITMTQDMYTPLPTATITPLPTVGALPKTPKTNIGDMVYIVSPSPFQQIALYSTAGSSDISTSTGLCLPGFPVQVLDISASVLDPDDPFLYYKIACTMSGREGWTPEYTIALFGAGTRVVVAAADPQGAITYSAANSEKQVGYCPNGTETKTGDSIHNIKPETDSNIYVQIDCEGKQMYVHESDLKKNE